MGKKRKDEAEPNGVALADPPVGEPSAAPQSNGEVADPPAQKNRPGANFAAMSDRTTRLEVTCWSRQTTGSDGEEYTQFALTASRSWRDKDGNWTANGFYRVHDVPVLLFLIQQGYQWCLLQRTEVRIETDETLPF